MSCHDNHEGGENCKDTKGMLDHVQEKIVSRKLLVFITATALMWSPTPAFMSAFTIVVLTQ